MFLRGPGTEPALAPGRCAVTVWFTSPREAARVLIGLTRMAPTSRLRLTWTETTGAEADVVVARGTVDDTDRSRVRSALEALGLAVVWDPQNRT